MTALFKRILSPRERGRQAGHDELPSPIHEVPSSSVSAATGQQGHKNNTADSIVVDNVIYSQPSQLDRVPPRGASGGAGGNGEDPPLPPRPSSASSGHAHQVNSGEHETYYCAPIDTLGHGTDLQRQQRSPSTREIERERAQERKRLDMHERTLIQKQLQGASSPAIASGHRRTRSGGHVIDNDEYSTPWNAQGGNPRRSSALPLKPPRKKSSAGKGIPSTPNDGSDNVIPVSPPPILSAPQDRSQSASPIPPRSPVVSSADAEYDDPWDVKNRKISQVIPSQHGRHHHLSLHERRSPPAQSGDPRPTRHSAGSKVDHTRHLPVDDIRPSRVLSEKDHLRSPEMEATEMPIRSRTITDLQSISISSPTSPRTGSVSMPIHPIQKRPLPEEPGNPNPIRREPSPSSTSFDSRLALEEQP